MNLKTGIVSWLVSGFARSNAERNASSNTSRVPVNTHNDVCNNMAKDINANVVCWCPPAENTGRNNIKTTLVVAVIINSVVLLSFRE